MRCRFALVLSHVAPQPAGRRVSRRHVPCRGACCTRALPTRATSSSPPTPPSSPSPALGRPSCGRAASRRAKAKSRAWRTWPRRSRPAAPRSRASCSRMRLGYEAAEAAAPWEASEASEAWREAVVTEAVVTEAPQSMVGVAQRVVVWAVTAARTARATHMRRRIHSTAMTAHAVCDMVCDNASDTNAAVSASAAAVEGSEADQVDGRDSQHRHPPAHPPAAMTAAATQTTRSAHSLVAPIAPVRATQRLLGCCPSMAVASVGSLSVRPTSTCDPPRACAVWHMATHARRLCAAGAE